VGFKYFEDISNNFNMTFTMFSLFGHGLSSGPITYVYLTDILPDIGVSFCLFFNWCFAAVITFSALFLNWDKNQRYTFDVFVFSALFAVLFMLFIAKETKGKS
jgi:FtsH-binding integral membrane protein